MLYALITLVTLIATALPSTADIYRYRDANGKLVISNQPPPAGAEAVKNRSGITTATNVMVRTACTLGVRPVDGGSAYLGTIGPRDSAGFQIPIILNVREYYVPGKDWFTPEIGKVSCDTEVTYDML